MNKKIFKTLIEDFKKAGKDPEVDWAIILTVSTILCVVFCIYSYTLFVDVNKKQNEVLVIEDKTPAFNYNGLKQIVEKNEEKDRGYKAGVNMIKYYTEPGV